jgi:hypothetical protein
LYLSRVVEEGEDPEDVALLEHPDKGATAVVAEAAPASIFLRRFFQIA